MENFNMLILDALTKASSQNAELIKIAELQLKCLEVQRGFYTTLMNVVADRNIDVHIRWLAAVCLKNGIDKYWRKTVNNSIRNEEREVIKKQLLASFDEPVNQISAQLALIIAKIARLDCPREWPELFPTLLNVIQQPDDLMQQRGLLTLHHVVKTLATKRLAVDRKLFLQLTSNLFTHVLHLWVRYSNAFIEEIKNSMSDHRLLLEKCLFCLKILRKSVVYGFKDPSKEVDAVNMFQYIFQQLKPFIECRKSMFGQEPLQEICEKYLILLVKVLRDVLEQHPFSYIQFIRPTLEYALTFCFTKEYNDAMFEKFTVQLLNIIKAILQCQEYKPAKDIEETKNPLTLDAHQIKVEFFTFPVLRVIIEQLLSRYFLLSQTDLKNWGENPEDFASDEAGESWKFSLRPCTEVLFLTFFKEFPNILTPLIVEATKNVHNSKATDFMSILKKEAIYNAIGLAAFDLYDEVDFDKWFVEVLIPELKVKENNYYIIRRRVIWLIGQWVGVKMSPELRPLLYDVVLQLLKNESDIVVRLAAANTLKIAVDDFEFNTEQFLPYLEASITALFTLLKEVRECDLKMSVLHVLSFVIERVGIHIRPHAESLMHYLPQLWDSCGEHNLLRCAIISCFVQLVQGLGILSENLHPFLLPMIGFSTNVTLPSHVYLLEDGLDLWWAIIVNTSRCSEQFLDVAQNLLPLLEYGSENLKKCLQIIEAYIILSPNSFFERYGSTLVKTFLYILTDMNSEGIVAVMGVVETALMVFPVDGPVFFQPVISSALSHILKNEELPIALSVYLSLVGRVILHNQNCFKCLLEEKATEMKARGGAEEVLEKFLNIWLESMNLVNPPEKRKLLGLALVCLLTSGSSTVHYNVCGIFLAIVEVLNDITRVDGSDSLIISGDAFVDEEDEETVGDKEILEHAKRKKELMLSDPVHTVVLKEYLLSQITAVQNSVGETKFQELMQSVDVETMKQLKDHLREM